MNKTTLLWLFLAAGAPPACTKDTAPKTTTTSHQDYGRLPFVVQDNYTYSYFYQGLQASGYADTLALDAGPFTLLVPDNDAMTASQFVYSGVNYFPQAFDPALDDYIRYLVIPGKVSFSTLPMGADQPFPTLQGYSVYITKYVSAGDTLITVNGNTVVATDVPASNGLIQVLGSVPEPAVYPNLWERMLKDPTLTFLTTAIVRAGLQPFFESDTQALTVLAPCNLAFTQMYPTPGLNLTSLDSIVAADPVRLRNLILYHVLKGRWFVSDFTRADTLAPDSVHLVMENGEQMTYTQGQFYSLGQVPSMEYVLVNGYYVQEHIGPLAPVPASYFSEYEQPGPRIAFADRPAGNGVLQEITSLMAP